MSSRVLLLSPCGLGNLGDAAIQDAAIAAIRERAPKAEILGITLNPDDTQARHGIPAMTLVGYSMRGYGVIEPGKRDADPVVGHETPSQPDRATLKDYARAAIPRVVWRTGSWLRRILSNVLGEVRHLARSWRMIRQADKLVISGGGQFDDYWGGPWGHPYAMARWTLLARLSGVPVYLASIGTCEFTHSCTRLFFRYVLKTSVVRSFRDPGSRDLLIELGADPTDTVAPDLAFGLFDPDQAVLESRPRIIAIGPISYFNPEIWPEGDIERYHDYLDRMAQLAAKLIEQGWVVQLFQSDRMDLRTSERIVARTRVRLGGNSSPIEIQATNSACDIVTLAKTASVVCASRLHSLILSGLASTPLVALSYDRKVEALMEMAELRDDLFSIDDFDEDAVVSAIEAAAAEQLSRRRHLHAFYSEEATKLSALFDIVVGDMR